MERERRRRDYSSQSATQQASCPPSSSKDLIAPLYHSHPNHAADPEDLSPAEDAPRYVMGQAVTLSMVGMGTAIYAVMWWWYRRANRRRDEGEVREAHRGLLEEELKELGDESPHYRYTH